MSFYIYWLILDARSECTGTVTTEEQSDISNLSRCLSAIRLNEKQQDNFIELNIGVPCFANQKMYKIDSLFFSNRNLFTFLFSHIGLLALVSGYCILGGKEW